MKKYKILFGALLLPTMALSLCAGFLSGQSHAIATLGEPDAHVHDDMTLLGEGDSLPSTPGSYCLTSDLVVSSTWSVPAGETRLCLNGHGIRKTGSGSLISVATGATLSIDDCGETVHYFDVDASNHYAKNINENEGSGRSSFTGGYITGCAGIYAIAIIGGTLNLNGGTIIGNYQNSGGKGVGVNVGNGGTFNMHGGTISYNYCQNTGGGVMVRYGNMYMDGGVITHNKTGWAGGSAIGVHFANESTIPTHVRISGGVIENNYTQNTYGAIDVNTGNSNVFEIEGSPRIRNNWNNDTNDTTERNITLRSDYSVTAKAKLSAPLVEGADIGVRLHYNNGLGAFTEGWTTHMQGADPANYFFAEDATKDFLVDATGEAAIFNGGAGALVGGEAGWTHYQTLADAVNAWGDGQTLKLLANASYNLAVSSGTKTLDLNDYALTASGSSSVVIVSGGNLTIKDGSKNPTPRYYTCNQSGVASLSQNETQYSFEGGYIGGGVATQARGGGLRVYGSGTVNFVSGTVFGNNAGWGGGLWCADNAEVNISGTAALIGNYSSGNYTSGGGIFCEGSSSVTMTGGSIRHNSAQWSGGGIRDSINGSGKYLTITGGEITGNYSGSNYGNGFAFDMASTLRIGGSVKIHDNQGDDNLRIGNGKILEIVEPFTDEADIHVRVDAIASAFTTGWTTIMGEEAKPADYFVSDIQDYKVSLKNGEVILSQHDHSWSYSADGHVITASCTGGSDCDVGNQALTISAEGKTYDGSPVVATLSFSDGWTTDNGLTVPTNDDIVYSGNTVAGTYTASITVGQATATISFDIETDIEEPETTSNVPGVVISGLEDEANIVAEENPDASTVSVSMNIEEKEAEAAPHADDLIAEAPKKNLEFYEISLEKVVDGVSSSLSESTSVIEIVIPYENVNKRDVTVYSYHNGEIITYTQADTRAAGTFFLDKENGLVKIYTNKFSTFAIGYTPYYTLNVNLDLGSYTGLVNATLKEAETEEVLGELIDVALDEVCFRSLLKGSYVLTITWVDGGSNSISMPVRVG